MFKNIALELKNEKNITIYGPEKYLKNLCTSLSIQKWNSYHKIFAPFLKKYDIIHVSHQLSSYFHCKTKNQKKIVTLHDLNFLHENFSPKKIEKVRKKVNKNIGNADVIVCISNFAKKDFLENRNLFTLEREPRIEVVYNGIDFPVYKELEIEKFHFLKNKKFILNIGVMFPKKNQLSLLNMLLFVEEDLVFVTSDLKSDYAEELQHFVLKNNIEERVHVFKNVTDDEKLWLLKHCIAMCHPSLAEGFGIPPIEAMSFGKPIFLSKLTSLPEIGGDVAFYFENLNLIAWQRFLKKGMEEYNKEPEKFKENLKTRAHHFEAKKMAQEYLKIYKSLQ